MDLPTYTNIWRIEKRLYKLYDFRLPAPLPITWIGVFAGITVPYVVFLIAVGLPFNHNLVWLYVLPPGVLTWMTTRPVIENKRLPELVGSQLRYLSEPRTWCRMAAFAEKDEIVVSARVWHRQPPRARSKQATKSPVPARSVAPARPASGASPARSARPARAGVRAPRPARATAKPLAVQPLTAPQPVALPPVASTGPAREMGPAPLSVPVPVPERTPARRAPRRPGPPGRRPVQPATEASPQPALEPVSPPVWSAWPQVSEPGTANGGDTPETRTGRRAVWASPAQAERPDVRIPDTSRPDTSRPDTSRPDTSGLGAKNLEVAHDTDPARRAPNQSSGPTAWPSPAANLLPLVRPLPEPAPFPDAGAFPEVNFESERDDRAPDRRESGDDEHGRGVLTASAQPEPEEGSSTSIRPGFVVGSARRHLAGLRNGLARKAERQGPSFPLTTGSRTPTEDEVSAEHDDTPAEDTMSARDTMPAEGTVSGAGSTASAEAKASVGNATVSAGNIVSAGNMVSAGHATVSAEEEALAEDAAPADDMVPDRPWWAPSAALAEEEAENEAPDEDEAAAAGLAGPQPPAARARWKLRAQPRASEAQPQVSEAKPADQPKAVTEAPAVPEAPPAETETAPRAETTPAETTPAETTSAEHAEPVMPPAAPEAATLAAQAPETEAGAEAEPPAPTHEAPAPVAARVVGVERERPLPSIERALSGPGNRSDASSWRRQVKVVAGGQGPGKRDQETLDRDRARLPLAAPSQIVVLGCTRGAGQTVTALMAGQLLAAARGVPVAALDLNPGPTSLSARRAPAITLQELLAGRGPRPPHPPELRARPAPGTRNQSAKNQSAKNQNARDQSASDQDAQLDVIASEPGHGPLEGAAIGRLAELLTERYALTMIDPSPAGLTRVLAPADQLILVAPASPDAATALANTQQWLGAHGYGELAARAVTVVNGVSRRTMPDVLQAESVARGRCRAIVRVPWDDGLAVRPSSPSSGYPQAIAYPQVTLQPQVRLAYTALAGVLMAGLSAASTSASASTSPGRNSGEHSD